MMTDLELRKLARMIVQEQAENEQWMIAFAKAQSKLQKPVEKLVSPAKAAEIRMMKMEDPDSRMSRLEIRSHRH